MVSWLRCPQFHQHRSPRLSSPGNASCRVAGTSQGCGKIISSSISFPTSVLTSAGKVPTAPFPINEGAACLWMGSSVSPLPTEVLRKPPLIVHPKLMQPVGPVSSVLTYPNPRGCKHRALSSTHSSPFPEKLFFVGPRQSSCLTQTHRASHQTQHKVHACEATAEARPYHKNKESGGALGFLL